MHKKKIIFFILMIFLVILFIFLSIISFNIYNNKRKSLKFTKNYYDKNFTSSPFSIKKIVYFSSADATCQINANSSFNISNLFQYTDFAIFIDNNSTDGFSEENTLKEVSISNISFYLPPTIGSANLYYKNINDFATSKYDINNSIQDKFYFEISSANEIDYSKPILYNNCANPLTFCYVNSNLISNYTLTNITNISYNGNLLKNCNITLNSIACKIGMLITITNNLNQKYTCPIIITIPLSTENSTIYDGNIIFTSNCNYQFIKQVN